MNTAGVRAGHVASPPDAAARERTIVLLAALSWLAAVIHGAMAPEHWAEHPSYAVCFALLAVLQGTWAIVFFRAPTARLLRWVALAAAGLRLARDWPAGRILASLLPLGLAVLLAGGVALMAGGHAH